MKYSVAIKVVSSVLVLFTQLKNNSLGRVSRGVELFSGCELAVHNLYSASVVPENSLHPTLCTKTQVFYCHILLRMWEKDQSNINNLFKNTYHEVSN